ncbi:MAG: hypothetical protein LBG48_04565 [Rickettsiales bacterium]|jgi:hypothetical protein|nr:hypothetical protein [Rickettsiales bacterium]
MGESQLILHNGKAGESWLILHNNGVLNATISRQTHFIKTNVDLNFYFDKFSARFDLKSG